MAAFNEKKYGCGSSLISHVKLICGGLSSAPTCFMIFTVYTELNHTPPLMVMSYIFYLIVT